MDLLDPFDLLDLMDPSDLMGGVSSTIAKPLADRP